MFNILKVLIVLVLCGKSDDDITRVLRCWFCVAHFYRLHGEIVERCFSLQNQIIFMLVKLSILRFRNPELIYPSESIWMFFFKLFLVL